MKSTKNMSKRALSLLLALVMCFGMVNLSAFAVTDASAEHIHNEGGWTCEQAESTQTLTCVLTEHTHGEACYTPGEAVLNCEDAHHTEECYNEDNELVCEETHEHTDECYVAGEPVLACELAEHTHTDECYTIAEGAWTCTPPEQPKKVAKKGNETTSGSWDKLEDKDTLKKFENGAYFDIGNNTAIVVKQSDGYILWVSNLSVINANDKMTDEELLACAEDYAKSLEGDGSMKSMKCVDVLVGNDNGTVHKTTVTVKDGVMTIVGGVSHLNFNDKNPDTVTPGKPDPNPDPSPSTTPEPGPKTVDLAIKKTVENPSEMPDKNQAFKINVRLGGKGGTHTDETEYKGNGDYVFTLKNGKTATITGIPVGTPYAVTEYGLPEGWTNTNELELPGFIGAGDTAVGSKLEKPKNGKVVNVEVKNRYEKPAEPVDPTEPDPTGNITVTKVWQDNDNVGATRKAITIRVFANGAEERMVLLPTGKTEYTFTDLPIYDADGEKIQYTVTEDRVNGYNTPVVAYDGEATSVTLDKDETAKVTVTNTLEDVEPEVGSIKVTKVWQDDNNADETRKAITIRVFANGAEERMVLLPTGKTEYTFTDLPIYDADGEKIQYTVTEDQVNGYNTPVVAYPNEGIDVTLTADEVANVTITNTLKEAEPENPETGDLTVTKVVSGTTTDEKFTIVVTLGDAATDQGTANAGSVEFKGAGVYTFRLGHDESATITGIDANTKYEVTEPDLEKWNSTINQGSGNVIKDGVSVTVTNTPQSTSGGGGDGSTYTSLTVNKVWDDGNDSAKARPNSVSVQLLRDGEPSTRNDAVQTLDEANGWSYRWSNLSSNYKWSVEELDVPTGYTDKITNSGTRWTITNTYSETDITDPETPKTDNPGDETENTGGETEIPDVEPPLVDVPEEQPPLVDVPEEQPPLVDVPEVLPPLVNVPAEEVPMANIPDEEVPMANIPDEDVPMVGVPQTGDFSMAWCAAAMLSVIGLVVLTFKKREENEI